MVHIGARLARRFTLLESEPADVPGVERFVAHDSRLQRDVRVDVITALAPSSARQAAATAARVRDPRLLRVLASGRERIADEAYTYVVTERPEGTLLSEVLKERRVPARVAATIVGDAARALENANAEGVHHGYLRTSSLGVTSAGRVVLSGLGIDGELAMQAGVGRGASESSDAMALGRIYLAAITGLDADAATERDLPADLGVRARKMCIHVINGSGPLTLDAVLHTLAPVDTRTLRDFPSMVRSMPLLPASVRELQARKARESRSATDAIPLGADVAARADHAAQETQAEALADAELRPTLAVVDAATGLGAVPPDQVPAPDSAATDPLVAPLTAGAVVDPPEVEAPLGANELHDLYEFDEMVAVQDVNNTTSTWEAILERMHRRWPGSEAITERLDRAHSRANRSGPIKAAPVLIPLMAIAVVVALIVALSQLTSPLSAPENDNDLPSNTYPSFTHSPSPSPSPSISPSAAADDAE
ncbi:hypothetical protein [Demequina aurantiaca]|uniref:hypothetical protein n=1 Tax=Demequina aurantiaca TaxID=676200 RepID=UPI003D352484